MKKMISLILSLLLAVSLIACTGAEKTSEAETTSAAPATSTPATEAPTEEPTKEHIPPEPVETSAEPELLEPFYGVWYGDYEGMTIRLELREDLTYTMNYTGDPEGRSGSFRQSEDRIWLEDDEGPTFTRANGLLYWSSLRIFLSREEIKGYEPGEVLMETAPEIFAGYWKSAYVEMDGAIWPARALGDETDLYIKDTKAALGGPIFGDVILDLTYENGSFLLKGDEDDTIRFDFQEDGYLRLSLLTSGEDPLIIYLAPAWLKDAEFIEGE